MVERYAYKTLAGLQIAESMLGKYLNQQNFS